MFFYLQHQPHSENEGKSTEQPSPSTSLSNQGFRDVLIQNAAFGTIPFMFWLHDISDVCGDVTSEAHKPWAAQEIVPMQPQEKTGS